jgi:hypothetical protein
MTMTTKASPQFVVCLKNNGYEASLESRKIYQVLSDKEAESHKMIRVIDESGEDYLFPVSLFSPISLPQTLVRDLALSAQLTKSKRKKRLDISVSVFFI